MQRRRLDGHGGFMEVVFGGYMLSFLHHPSCDRPFVLVSSSLLAIPFLGGRPLEATIIISVHSNRKTMVYNLKIPYFAPPRLYKRSSARYFTSMLSLLFTTRHGIYYLAVHHQIHPFSASPRREPDIGAFKSHRVFKLTITTRYPSFGVEVGM